VLSFFHTINGYRLTKYIKSFNARAEAFHALGKVHISNQYFGFIKFFPILNLDLNGVSYEQKETSLWSAPTNRSAEVSEKRSKSFRVDKNRC